jgi:hypothetical protein
MSRHWSIADACTDAAASPEFEREVGRTLADEIAIDFPSMLGPIGRMRAGFGDTVDVAPHVAHVELSAFEAWRGARVPLEVPLTRSCPGCGGRGETWGAPCSPCAGTGLATEPYLVTLTVPAGVVDGARFAFSVAHPRGHRASCEVRVAVL